MNEILNKLGVKVALIVNFFILIVITVGTYILISSESQRLEEELLAKGRQQSLLGAKMIGTILAEAIDNEVLTVDQAFDTDYEPIKDIVPPRYHTKYDRYLDKAILELQDEFLKDDSILYAVASDLNGYVPTHNSRYQKPMTGDPEKDKIGNRTKQLFRDSVGLKAAQNTTPAFLQIYHRDTGEVLWDISSPIYVRNKHWGGFRVGMSLESINEAKNRLGLTLFGIMASILFVSIVLTFLIVNRALSPVRKLSQVAYGLAKGQYLGTEISVTSKDEIGQLQQALERLRLSMLIALKRIKKTAR